MTLTWRAGGGGVAQWYTITDASGNVVDRVAAEPDGSAPPGWADTALVNGTSSTYFVSAGNVAGESPPAGPVSATPRAPLVPIVFTVAGFAGTSAIYATGSPQGTGTEGTVFGVLRGEPLPATPIGAAGRATVAGTEALIVQFQVDGVPWELRFRRLLFGPIGTLEVCGPSGCETGIGIQLDAVSVPIDGFGLPPRTGSTTTTLAPTPTTSTTGPTTTSRPSVSTTTTTTSVVADARCAVLSRQLAQISDPSAREHLLRAMRALGCS